MNIEEIARISGVSRSTVSRVLNEDARVRKETRLHVQEVINRLGFQPNAIARSLASGKSHILGLVIPVGVSALFGDPYFPLLIQGVSSACNARDYSVVLWLAEPEFERRMMREILHNGLVSGVIVASMVFNDPIVQALSDSNIPFILVGRHPDNKQVSYVDVDNLDSAREAVSHLLRLGRKRVATITGPQNMVVGIDRYQGYLQAIRRAHLPLDPNLVAEADFSDMGGYFGMQKLLPYHPDAVFAASDVMAVGAMRAIGEAGLHIPADIAVVGYDDIPLAAHTNPPLTTIRQPTLRTGLVSTELLIEMVEHPVSPPQRIVLPTELIIRSTCGSIKS
ncbi:MAG: LacI family DNA-binding transcriptional regulator [Anaerolineaceae bacterium]|nr:LacI family DNA-binding transcriptional regulator [Anaerolineaceae bacterium]